MSNVDRYAHTPIPPLELKDMVLGQYVGNPEGQGADTSISSMHNYPSKLLPNV